MLSLPAQVHLPWLGELLLDQRLHCLAQVLCRLSSPSLAAISFCLNVQQVAKAGTGLGHLEQEDRRCIKPSTQLWTLPVRVPSGLSHAKLCLQRLREKTRILQRLPQLHQQNLITLTLLHPPPSYPKVWWEKGNLTQVGKNSGST